MTIGLGIFRAWRKLILSSLIKEVLSHQSIFRDPGLRSCTTTGRTTSRKTFRSTSCRPTASLTFSSKSTTPTKRRPSCDVGSKRRTISSTRCSHSTESSWHQKVFPVFLFERKKLFRFLNENKKNHQINISDFNLTEVRHTSECDLEDLGSYPLQIDFLA